MRIRVHLDRSDHTWLVSFDASGAIDRRALLASGVQAVHSSRHRSWDGAMVAAGRLAGRAELREAAWLASWIQAREAAGGLGQEGGVRIRVYLDRTDRLWRVVGVGVGSGVDPAAVAARLQQVQHRGAGIGYPTWVEAQAAADRMAAKSRRVRQDVAAAAASWQAQR